MFFTNEIFFFHFLTELELIKRKGKKICIIDARKIEDADDPVWMRTKDKIPYDKDEDIMKVLLSHLLEEQQGTSIL